MRRSAPPALAVAGLVLAAGAPVLAADWPQWRGPGRDGVARSLAHRDAWPETLAPAWRVTVGEGHSSPVVVGGRVYAFARLGEDEVVRALHLATGEPAWQQSYPAPYTMNPAAHSHGKGPKSTPVVAEGRLFTLGISGILSAFDAASGRVLWRHDFRERYRDTAPIYGTAMSPAVDAGRLIAHVGGRGRGALTAFDAATGDVVWEWAGDGPGYASPVVADVAGTRQVVTFGESSLVGVDARDGALLWSIPFTTSYDQNAVTPIVDGDRVIYSGLDHPLRAVRVKKGPGGWTTEPDWENADVAAYMSTPVLAGGRIFGFSHRKRGQLFALDAASGGTLWLSEGRQGDNAAIVVGEKAAFFLTTGAELLAVPRDGSRFAPEATWRVGESPTWAHPVVLDEGVLVKDAETLAMWRFEGGTGAAPAASEPPEKGVDMSWIYFVVGAVLSWGLYGPVLHKGQVALGSPLKAFLFVGLAYFLVGVLVPLLSLASQGQLSGFTTAGATTSTVAGILGALGAVCVIYAFRAGGTPLWVMPLVFAGAPIVNVLYSMWQHPPRATPSPMLYVGFLLAATGAYMVLHYKPQG